jgi:cytidine deaminase
VAEALTPAEEARLLEGAIRAHANASAPYSKFRVGAAVLDGEGRVFGGCNVESASYGLTICAERNAVFAAIANGARRFRGVAVVIDAAEPCTPCGACRQVLWDQCRDVPVLLGTTSGAVEKTTLAALLPRAFEFGGAS